jgi:site-specific recombinase XerD
MPRQTFKKIITSPELIGKINPENIKLMNAFLKEKNTRCSDMTIEGYRSDLNIFFCWNVENNNNKLFTNIRKIEFSEFFSFAVNELHWSSARFSRGKAALSSFSNFIEKFYDDIYPQFRNVILKVIESMPKNTVREKTILSQEQVENLFKHFYEDKKNPQICCWLALGIASGSRFSELLRFTTDNIDENHTAFDGIFLETLKPIKTKGRTKSGKLLVKYIIKDLFWKYYQQWLIFRKEVMENNNKSHNFIFIKENGDPALESTAREWVKEIEDFLEIPFYPHCLRHFTTSYLAKIGLPYELIKEIFGWENLEMVSIYNDITAKDKSWSELGNLKKALEEK